MVGRTRTALFTLVILAAACGGELLHAQQTVSSYVDSAHALVARSITPRTDSSPPAEPPQAWMEYIGEYGSPHDPVVLLEHAGSLHVLFGGMALQPLKQIARDTFQLASDTTPLVFVRDRSRRVAAVSVQYAWLERRALGPEDGATFRIKPLKPADELRRIALAASPPVESGEFLTTDLVEVRSLDPTIHYDIRYATDNNFMGDVFYSEPHAFMQRAAAEALARAANRLRAQGYGLMVHDAYRPWYVTKMFLDATPDSLREFVADPANGSRHNRGAAVDLSMYDLKTGKTVVAVSGYDEFSPRAYPEYAGGTSRQRWYRAALRAAMEAEGFAVYRNEWWHFDYGEWRRYRIGNQRFEDMR
ncbi:MAG: M15 family metallopeptidase [Longimicrobiales bacterium]